MLTLFKPRALFSAPAKLPETANQNCTLVQNNNCNQTRAVAVFSHHRDLKVALDELHHAGFSRDWITLITRKTKHCSWCSELIANNYFEAKFNCSQVAQKFFWRLFQRGKYLVLLSGSDLDVNAASKIMSRRQDHVKIWRLE
jgi:arginyl-tRNA--protein-N-Asp/Glu arginylyltransferase